MRLDGGDSLYIDEFNSNEPADADQEKIIVSTAWSKLSDGHAGFVLGNPELNLSVCYAECVILL